MIRAAVLLGMLSASAPAFAQTAFPTPDDKSAAIGTVIMCLNTQGKAVPCQPGSANGVSAQMPVGPMQAGQAYAPMQVIAAPQLQLPPPPWAPFRPVCIASSNPATCRPGP